MLIAQTSEAETPETQQRSSSPDPEAERVVRSVCPYCGVGCGVQVWTSGNRVTRVKGDPLHPANHGALCAKGGNLAPILAQPDRLLHPYLRATFSGEFQQATWHTAITQVADRLRNIIARYGPDSIAFYGSGQFLTEDYYTINKLLKGCIGTNNFDSNSRLCMSSTVAGYRAALGQDGPPASYNDIELSDCFFLLGSNTAACHPVTFNRIKAQKRRGGTGATLIVADPRRTETADLADFYLPLRPGSDVTLLNALIRLLDEAQLLDYPFIAAHTTGWEALRDVCYQTTLTEAATLCDLPAEQIRETALAIGRSKTLLTLWSMGLNQSSSGVEKNRAAINLSLVTGRIGLPGSGPFSLTGQPNAMGGREVGGLAHLLPGYRHVASATDRDAVAAYWGVPSRQLSPKAGLAALDLFTALEDGRVRAIWIAATNPLVSMPDVTRTERALRRADLVIVQDAYSSAATVPFAHILLPAAQWAEREGTMTNSERRISLLQQAVAPMGEARPDWEIFTMVAREMGYVAQFPFTCAEEVFEEYKGLTMNRPNDISGMSYSRLRKGPLQWPCPNDDHPGTERLYTTHHFATPDGRAQLAAISAQPLAEPPDAHYPFILTTGRVRDQWHTMTRTGKIPVLLRQQAEPLVEMHPDDAEQLGVQSGDEVTISSRRGSVRMKPQITERIRPGSLFVPMHWGDTPENLYAINRLTLRAADPTSGQPELKACAVALKLVPKAEREPCRVGGGMNPLAATQLQPIRRIDPIMSTSSLTSLPPSPATPREPGKRQRLLAFVPASSRPYFARHKGDRIHVHSGDSQWFMENISCQAACPARTDVSRYIAAIAAGEHDVAYHINKTDNLFPGILGRTCARPCETACRRGKIDDPIAICALKRGAADYRKDFRLPVRPELSFSETIAIVGAGPAGLACAAELAQWGYAVTVFDALPVAGGLLRSGIPEFRLPGDLLKAEVDDFFAALGVTFRLNTHIGRDIPLTSLLSDYSAVYLAAGTQVSRRLGIRGEEHPAVVSGLDFMKMVNLCQHEAHVGRRVVVIGGGFTALDCCRSAVRLGATTVHVLYRRGKMDMSASKDEIEQAEQEGVNFDYLVSPVSIRPNDSGAGVILRCVRNSTGTPERGGKRQVSSLAGSEFEIEADTIIAAVGQQTELSWVPAALEIPECNGMLQVDPLTFATGIHGLFAGGDFTAGPRNIISAVADGRKAAIALHHTLRKADLPGKSDEDTSDVPAITISGAFEQVNVEAVQSRYHRQIEEEINADIATRPSQQPLTEAYLGRPVHPELSSWTRTTLDRRRKQGDNYEAVPRQAMPTIPVPERANPAREVESGFTPETAATEARRCLQCQMNIFIDGQVCILCNTCSDVCPVNVISMISSQLVETLDGQSDAPALVKAKSWEHGAAMVIDEDLCVRCGLCVQFCPTKCLTMQSFTPQPNLPVLVQVGRGKRALPVHCERK